MKKSFFTMAISLVFFSIAGGQTNVSGTLTVNTTWSSAGNPYNIVGNVGVPKNVTLTIQPGVIVNFNTQYQIIVKEGVLVANGDSANPIVFNGNASGSAMILFQKCSLGSSAISWINLNGPKNGIQLSTNNSDNNTGTLTVSHLTDNNSQIITNGLTSSANLVIDHSTVAYTTIHGAYPASEKIQIQNSTIQSCTVWSDAYNYGISLLNDSCINSSCKISVCYSSINFQNCRVYNSTVNGEGADFTAKTGIRNSAFYNSSVKIPGVTAGIYSSLFSYDASYSGNLCIIAGVGVIDSTVFSGKSSLIAIERKPLFDEGNHKFKIAHCSFENYKTDIKISTGTGLCDSILIKCCDFLDRPPNYTIYNNSSRDIWAMGNWWGTTSSTAIDSTIYDFWDDIALGPVFYSPPLSNLCALTLGLPSREQIPEDISIRPNPVSTEAAVEWNPPASNTTLMICNYLGQTVQQLNNLMDGNVIIHRKDLPGGIYFLRLMLDGHQLAAKKLIFL